MKVIEPGQLDQAHDGSGALAPLAVSLQKPSFAAQRTSELENHFKLSV